MIKKALWLSVLLLTYTLSAYAQCNHRLVEIAAENAGADAVFLRDFKVKLSKGTMDEPSPTGKFPVFLNKGVMYRFTVADAEEYEGRAIVEIRRRGQLFAGNYDFNSNIYSSSFDFKCERSSTYQILINYGAGKEGCTAVVMSMVLQDSLTYINPSLPYKSDSAETLYLWLGNELHIASTEGNDAELDVEISQGSITKKGGIYIAKPETTGTALIKVKVIKNNKVIESDSVLYYVEYPPLPVLKISGETGGYLSINEFNRHISVETKPVHQLKGNPYTLERFSFMATDNMLSEYHSDNDKLSIEQIQFIRGLKPDDKFYITKVVFTDPRGKTHTMSGTREIIIKE